jgi:hypothetical protein
MKNIRKMGIIVGVFFLIALFSDIISISITNPGWIMILDVISGIAIMGVGISVFFVLKPYNKILAASYAGIRIVEGLIFFMMVLLFVSKSTAIIDFIYVYIFVIGALILYYSLYQSRLVPRWISVWGIIAIFILGVLNSLGMLGSESTLTLVLASPIALNELVLAMWLIVKGFNKT